jgi:UDP-N-acetylmuramate--alanine ligase
VLGEISKYKDTLAVCGTHGKTTVSTMTAHIFRQSSVGCSAFLGGISKNYDSNLLTGNSRYTVMEADEFDRSFHRLEPAMAIVTSVDADHLDIYGDAEKMVEAYNVFFTRIREGGSLIINSRIADKIKIPAKVRPYTYGIGGEADFRIENIKLKGEEYSFDLTAPGQKISDIRFTFPGMINVENAAAAAAMALLCGITPDEIRAALYTFQGVQRRFDVRINRPGLVYIDDYAHHPEEIRACITSVREFFGSRKITAVFQPHLFTRTRDHAEGFARILDMLDEVILLPVYPARENPIEGVSSSMIYERMRLGNRKLLAKTDIPGKLDIMNLDVLLTIGAGDIDRLVGPIEEALNMYRR